LPSPCVACLAEPTEAYYDKAETILLSEMVARVGMKAMKKATKEPMKATKEPMKATKKATKATKKATKATKAGLFARSHKNMAAAKKASTVARTTGCLPAYYRHRFLSAR
jgi:mannitol-specific phosphotransferase system IIBC component